MITIKYKIYKSKKTKHLDDLITTAGRIWNHIVALDKMYYRLFKKSISPSKLDKHISKLRKRNPHWKKLNSQTVQELVQRYDASRDRFFKKLSKRLPKFKKSKDFSSIVFKQIGYILKDNTFLIRSINKKYKFTFSREYSNVKNIRIKRNKLGEYFIYFVCDIKPEKLFKTHEGAIGLDFGLKTYLTTSDGISIDSPQFFKKYSSLIKSKSRNLSKKQRGSHNRNKARTELARLHDKIANKRSDFHWKLAHQLCKENEVIAIEDLYIAGMSKIWGRKINDLSHAAFIKILEYVAFKYDTTVIKIDRFYPSSKLCYSCGNIKKDLSLKDRTYVCECGHVEDRDLMASKNILRQGIALLERSC